MLNRKSLGAGIWIVLIFAAVIMIFTLWKVAVGHLFFDRVAQGVYLENILVEGCDRQEIAAIVFELKEMVDRPAVDAVFDDSYNSIIPELDGWSVDVDASIERIMNAVAGESVLLVKIPVEAEITLKDYPTATIYQGNPLKNQMTLLINVDWGIPEPLNTMLDQLRDADVKTTFCVTGRVADKFPDSIARISAEGHELANHSYHHDGGAYQYRNMSVNEVKNEILEAERAIFRTTGVKPKYFSPPAGIITQNILQAAFESRYQVVLWTPGLDTVDWQEPGVTTIIKRVVSNATNGGIALMHPKEQTAEALPVILKELREADIQIVPLRVLLSPYIVGELK